jgi:hypothetical protein
MSGLAFEPEIVAFCCRHCAYAAADLAGAMRLEDPSQLPTCHGSGRPALYGNG